MIICIHPSPHGTNRYKDKLILFGGTCGSFFYNHLFEYDTIEQVSHSAYIHIQQSRGREGSERGGWAGLASSICSTTTHTSNPN